MQLLVRDPLVPGSEAVSFAAKPETRERRNEAIETSGEEQERQEQERVSNPPIEKHRQDDDHGEREEIRHHTPTSQGARIQASLDSVEAFEKGLDSRIVGHLAVLRKHPPRQLTGELAPANRGSAVHEDVHHALGVVVRIGVLGDVANRVEVEHHDIRRGAGT